MKKSQLIGRPVIISLFTIIAIVILIFGAKQISNWIDHSKKLEKVAYYNSLGNTIKKQSRVSFGSIDEKTVALPSGAETICFVDRSKEISPLINCKLNDELNKYEDKNVFFEPFDTLDPIKINNFKLDKDENPLCLKTFRTTTKLSLKSQTNFTLVSTFRPSEKKVDCVSIVYNSHPNNSIDIVFLGYAYKSFDDFRKDVNENINMFLQTEPFSSNKEKINFYRIDRFQDLDCNIASWIKCDEFSVKKLASYCPHDYVIVLVDRSKIKDMINPIRSSAVSNMAKINTADNDRVVLHEFGHIFGKLADEYVDEKYYSNINFNPGEYPNCDLPSCSKWRNIENTSCFKGCSLKSYSRPTKNSIMRSLNTNEFGPLNEKVLTEKLNVYEKFTS